MKLRKSIMAAIVAASVALTLGTAGTASATTAYSFKGGKAWFRSDGEILTVYDTKAGKTGIVVDVEDRSAKNPTFDQCSVKGKGKTKTCDMSFAEGHKLKLTVYSYTKLSDDMSRWNMIVWYDDKA